MKEFKNFYEGEKGNSQSDLNILNMTAHTFPKDYAEIFWREALEWALENKTDIGYAGEAIPADIIRKELDEN